MKINLSQNLKHRVADCALAGGAFWCLRGGDIIGFLLFGVAVTLSLWSKND